MVCCAFRCNYLILEAFPVCRCTVDVLIVSLFSRRRCYDYDFRITLASNCAGIGRYPRYCVVYSRRACNLVRCCVFVIVSLAPVNICCKRFCVEVYAAYIICELPVDNCARIKSPRRCCIVNSGICTVVNLYVACAERNFVICLECLICLCFISISNNCNRSCCDRSCYIVYDYVTCLCRKLVNLCFIHGQCQIICTKVAYCYI